jgi:hypothetical protein
MATGRPDYMEDPVGQKFHWVTSGEPHAMRRREILAKYGSEVRKLYGYDHKTAWVVSLLLLNKTMFHPMVLLRRESTIKLPLHFTNLHRIIILSL